MAVPMTIWVRVGRVTAIVRIFACAIRLGGAVPAEKPNIVHHRARTGLPECRHGAWIIPAGIKPDSDDNVAAALGRFQEGFGAPDALITRRAVRQYNLRRARMQSDQRGVGSQFQCVMHDVKSGRQINGAVGRNRILKRFSIVGASIAFGAQITQVHPYIARGQGGQIGNCCGRHGSLRDGVKIGLDFRCRSDVGKAESVRKTGNFINLGRGVKAFAAIAQGDKVRHAAASNPFHIDFSSRALFHPKNECRAGNVFKPGVLDAQFVGPLWFDFNGGGDLSEVRANERQSGFVLENGRFTLAFK